MVDKLHEYQGFVGRCHTYRDNIRGKWCRWKENHPGGTTNILRKCFERSSNDEQKQINDETIDEYTHIYRRKTRGELVRVSAAVMGIEFSYAAETAFVSPTLLKIGVEHKHMTLVWALSPLVGFFLTPVLGSLSDRCRSRLGRRRPFIIMLALGVLIGLILVPNGEDIGYAMGDERAYTETDPILPHRTSAAAAHVHQIADNTTMSDNITETHYPNSHPWGVLFTILGTVLLDFDADACQSPSRAYLLDVTVPDDHAKGLSTFTIMAGLGGFFGYGLGGINWDVTVIGILLGGHVRAVFTLITIIFIICVTCTITSFKEIPLTLLDREKRISLTLARKKSSLKEAMKICVRKDSCYGTSVENMEMKDKITRNEQESSEPEDVSSSSETSTKNYVKVSVASHSDEPDEELQEVASLKEYLRSIVVMPRSMRILCLTNLFCWMAHVCYSLYFTDFVGEAVFGGNPQAVSGTVEYNLYEEGVRFGCWGMSMYSLSCACYSLIIERLIKRFRARTVYVGGLLVYSTGMLLMALTKHRVGVILFSWSAGVMYSTLFTMPYLLIAHYHAMGTFEIDVDGQAKIGSQIRGLGTDVAIVSSMVFLAQFILSMCMGTIVTYSGTTTAVVAVASTLSFFGAITATQINNMDVLRRKIQSQIAVQNH